MTTREQLQGKTTAELLKLYNEATGSKLHRFESRKVAIERTFLALQEKAKASASPSPSSFDNVRTIRSEGSKLGRPKLSFTVEAIHGSTDVRGGSLRGKILAHLRTMTPPRATIEALEAVFGVEKTRGAVQKLLEKNHLKRITAA